MIEIDEAAVEQFWQQFRAAVAAGHPVHGPLADTYQTWWFGDSPAMADELSALVLHGPKRATAGLARDAATGWPMPELHGLSVIVDGRGQPVALLRTTEVRTGPFSSVDAAFAWDEGEGDRTLGDWVAAHRRFFERQGANEGFEFTDDEPVMFERFEVLWPPTPDPG